VTRARLIFAIKYVIAHVFYYTGLLTLWQAVALRRKAVVLMYHRVLTDSERQRCGSHPGIIVGRDTFQRQMSILNRHFVVLTLEQFHHRLAAKIPFQSSSCLITFDDGWQDTFTNALPVLAQRSLPAVVFLPVNYIGRRRMFWRERLTQLLSRTVALVRTSPNRRARVEPLLEAAGFQHILDLRVDHPHPAIVDEVSARTKASAPVSPNLLAALEQEIDAAPEALAEADAFMDWSHVEAMATKGVAFGGHGAEHYLLTEVSTEIAQSEIQQSIDMVRQRFAGTVPAFGYPNGSWTPAVARQVEAAGYQLAFTTQPGHVSCNDDRFSLRRMNIHEDMTNTTPMFLARLVGLF
jgi:peptidoglycan/xylan/chitin deacetylase (PgdA/CDA1 family)